MLTITCKQSRRRERRRFTKHGLFSKTSVLAGCYTGLGSRGTFALGESCGSNDSFSCPCMLTPVEALSASSHGIAASALSCETGVESGSPATPCPLPPLSLLVGRLARYRVLFFSSGACHCLTGGSDRQCPSKPVSRLSSRVLAFSLAGHCRHVSWPFHSPATAVTFPGPFTQRPLPARVLAFLRSEPSALLFCLACSGAAGHRREEEGGGGWGGRAAAAASDSIRLTAVIGSRAGLSPTAATRWCTRLRLHLRPEHGRVFDRIVSSVHCSLENGKKEGRSHGCTPNGYTPPASRSDGLRCCSPARMGRPSSEIRRTG